MRRARARLCQCRTFSPLSMILVDFEWPETLVGPYRDNVVEFLERFATPVALPSLPHTLAWVMPLGDAEAGVRLQVFKEIHHTPETSVCDCCRIIGARRLAPAGAAAALGMHVEWQSSSL